LFKNFFKNKKILVTGHTGFKGTWLTLWLNYLGANVTGLSLSHGIMSKIFNNYQKNKNYFFNIENYKKLKKCIYYENPDIIFHLAAQSLVGKSYIDPLGTCRTNILGMINLLDILKDYKKKCSVVLITSDKVYKNLEQKKGYKENDILHGKDPYSASKSCADILAQSYINSLFLNNKNINFGIARAGNVIGGGDFSENRIIPDLVKSLIKNKKLIIRQPNSTRPWQHVIEIIFGYLKFSKYLYQSKKKIEILNFGPRKNYNFKVIDVAIKASEYFNLRYSVKNTNFLFKESRLLKLNSIKAEKIINWKSVLNFKESINLTMQWYNQYLKNKRYKVLFLITIQQIINYYLKINNVPNKKN